jgi:allantoin racemase
VPVVDSSTVALKYLEAMTDISRDLGLVKSTRQHLKPPARDALDRARRSLDLI